MTNPHEFPTWAMVLAMMLMFSLALVGFVDVFYRYFGGAKW